MNNIQKLIDAVALGDKEQMADAFSAVMQDKVRTAIDVKTIETAEKIYNAEQTESENEETLSEAKIEIPADSKGMKGFLDKAKTLRASQKDYDQSMANLDLKQFTEFDKIARGHKDFKKAYELGYDMGMGEGLPKRGGLEGNNPHKKNTLAYHIWMDLAGQGEADA